MHHKKTFYDQHERLTYLEEGNQLCNDVHDALLPLMEKYVKQGYSIREIGHIMMCEAHSVLMTAVITPEFINFRFEEPTHEANPNS